MLDAWERAETQTGEETGCAWAAGMRIVAIGVDARGEIDIEELKAKATEHADRRARACRLVPA